jgi:hypothetical protein
MEPPGMTQVSSNIAEERKVGAAEGKSRTEILVIGWSKQCFVLKKIS